MRNKRIDQFCVLKETPPLYVYKTMLVRPAWDRGRCSWSISSHDVPLGTSGCHTYLGFPNALEPQPGEPLGRQLLHLLATTSSRVLEYSCDSGAPASILWTTGKTLLVVIRSPGEHAQSISRLRAYRTTIQNVVQKYITVS